MLRYPKIIAVVALLGLGCTPAWAAGGKVTVSGRVDLGPTCSVQAVGTDCVTRGAPATVTARSGKSVMKIHSGVNGFTLKVAPGKWTFSADAGMTCTAVVRELRLQKRPRPVVISCDTGMR